MKEVKLQQRVIQFDMFTRLQYKLRTNVHERYY